MSSTHGHEELDTISIATYFEDFHVVTNTGENVFSIRAQPSFETVRAERRDFEQARLLFEALPKDTVDNVDVHGRKVGSSSCENADRKNDQIELIRLEKSSLDTGDGEGGFDCSVLLFNFNRSKEGSRFNQCDLTV